MPANNNLDPAPDKARLADGRTGEKLTEESAMRKPKEQKTTCDNATVT